MDQDFILRRQLMFLTLQRLMKLEGQHVLKSKYDWKLCEVRPQSVGSKNGENDAAGYSVLFREAIGRA